MSLSRSILMAIIILPSCVSCDVSRSPGSPAASEAGHGYLQFASIPDVKTLNALAASGVLITDHASGTTYIASFGDGGPSASPLAGATYVGRIPLSAKAGEELLDGVAGHWAQDDGGRVLIRVMFHSDVSRQRALAAANKAGAELRGTPEFEGFTTADFSIAPGRIRDLAGDDAVRLISEIASPAAPCNIQAAAQSNVDALWTGSSYGTGSGLSGLGYTVGIWEANDTTGGGRVQVHTEFAGRVTWDDAVAVAPYSPHATKVAGTIGAVGLQNEAHGMATQVAMKSYDLTAYATQFEEAAAAGTIAANNSWGYTIGWTWNGTTYADTGAPQSNFGYYSNYTGDIDEAVRDADVAGQLMLVCFAAGNDRNNGISTTQHDGIYYPADTSISNPYYDTISHSSTGKNVLTVGAVNSSNMITSYSSIGPVDDGRIKPDLVAKGTGMYTTDLNDAYYYPNSNPVPPGPANPSGWNGTSAATPVVVGASALLVQQFETTFGRRPTTAELKALLVQTCQDLGRPGPDYVYGYGLLNAQAAADIIVADDGAGRRIVSDSVANANHDAFHFQVTNSSVPIRLTLAWIDAPGQDNSDTNDITNNLDIRLLSPGGATIKYPYKLKANTPLADASAVGPNPVDTVEQIDVPAPVEQGLWQVEIRGTTVPVGPVQKYALVSSHPLEAGWFVELQDVQFAYEADGDVTMSWDQINLPYVTGFRVLRRHLPNPWVVIADETQLGSSATGFVDTASPSTGVVWYDVRAVINVAGEEVFSANPGGQTTGTPSILTPPENASVPAATATNVTGVAEAGAIVTVYDNGSFKGSATAGSDGAWTLPGCIFGPAGTQRTLTAVAQQGNEGPSLPSFERHINVN